MKQYLKELGITILLIVAIIIFTILMLYPSEAKAQGGIVVSGYADLMLLIKDDDYGNKAPTFDTLITIELQGNQTKAGFLYLYPSIEYFDSSFAVMKRYSYGIGFVFNRWFKNVGMGVSVNHGFIHRFDRSFLGFGATADIRYRVSNKVDVIALLTLIDRRDILYAWGNRVIRHSGYIGISYQIKGEKKKRNRFIK